MTTTASPRHLELRLPARAGFLAVVEMAAHIYASAIPGAAALGERVEAEILEAAESMAADGERLVVTLEIHDGVIRATVSAEGDAGDAVELEWRV